MLISPYTKKKKSFQILIMYTKKEAKKLAVIICEFYCKKFVLYNYKFAVRILTPNVFT